MDNDDTFKIQHVWQDKLLRKIFLDILSNTQMRKCKQLKPIFTQKMNQVFAPGPMSDGNVYDIMYKYIREEVTNNLRCKIQHKSKYRNVNRANKIIEFIGQYYSKSTSSITSVLDLGCGEGNITNVVGKLLRLPKSGIHGCDIKPLQNDVLFTYSLLADPMNAQLPYADNQHDIVYAFMSLHHIKTIDQTIAEVARVVKPGGLLIIREHDCVTEGLSVVLDIVHGFYSMVWANPREKISFKDEYWAKYRTAKELSELICGHGFELMLNTSRDEEFPIYYKGKVVNPLKYYYAVYSSLKR